MKNIEVITDEVFEEYGNRKTRGRIDFVVDVTTNHIYAVPKNVEHSDFIPTIPNYTQKSSIYVPIQYRFRNGEVSEILVGASSYEDKHKVRHDMKELKKAHSAAWVLLIKSKIPVKVKRDKIFRTFLR